MKKWLIITLAVAVLMLLVARGFYLRLDRAKTERLRYVRSLGFHFSASVDSLRGFSPKNGLVYFHATWGKHNLSIEDEVNQKLKFNGSLRFALPVESKQAFHSRDMEKYRKGDSLVINSLKDKIYIYRQGKLSAESSITKALSGRPF